MNEVIKAPYVKLVGQNVTMGVYPVQQAVAMAYEQSLDLVEISSSSEPPICKILDYAKFRYTQKKKQKEIKAKAQQVVLKEIRFGPNTDAHDFDFKLRHATKFLSEGAKVKITIYFKGRAITFKERGELLLLRFVQALRELGKADQLPQMEGKRMILTVSPKSK